MGIQWIQYGPKLGTNLLRARLVKPTETKRHPDSERTRLMGCFKQDSVIICRIPLLGTSARAGPRCILGGQGRTCKLLSGPEVERPSRERARNPRRWPSMHTMLRACLAAKPT
ncbi:hypothetical protein BaRGS_00009841 [Batillaria attramentaria]|uniref:Uncharacterized protein n=1 Tax=Batillaria attramentaria TaxID=370345 RepID=A0ABD0LGN4_9CAEN